MIAYHFPPLAGGSGIQRTLRFARHLPALSRRLDSVGEIARILPAGMLDWRLGKALLPQALAVQQPSRRRRSQVLADLLIQAIAAPGLGASR